MTAPRAGPVASAATVAGYLADWQLFADWCTAVECDPYAAGPAAILTFLDEHPGRPGGQRRRVAAMNWIHDQRGVPSPGRDQAVSDRLRPGQALARADRETTVASVLRLIPSHGWPVGAFGRRDRALLVLSQRAGLTFERLQNLTWGELRVDESGLWVNGPNGPICVPRDADTVLCSVCAWVRWARILEIAMREVSTRVLAAAVAKTDPIRPESRHVCARQPEPGAYAGAPVFVPMTRWGDWALEPQAMYRKSLSAVVRAHLNGDSPVHQILPVPGIEAPPEHEPQVTSIAVVERAEDVQARMREGLTRRAEAQIALRNTGALLQEVEDRADELMRRTQALLAMAE